MTRGLQLALLLFLPFLLLAESKHSGMDILSNFYHEDYKGGNKVYAIESADDGYVYLGVKDGLVRFNGEKWHPVKIAMPVHSIALDQYKHVYVAGDEGLGVLKHDSLNHITFSSLNHLVSSKDTHSRFNNAKVFSLGEEIIFVINSKIIINTPERIRVIENKLRFDIAQKIDDKLYLCSFGNGVYVYHQGEIQLINNSDLDIINRTVGFVKNNDGLILWGNSGDSYLIAEDSIITLDKNGRYLTRGLTQMSENRYAVRTFYKGLLLIDQNLKVTKHLSQEQNLANNSIFCTKEDAYNNLWVGTARGISVFNQDFPLSLYNTTKSIGTGYAALQIGERIFLATSSGLWEKIVDPSTHKSSYNNLIRGHVLGISNINNTLYVGHPNGLFSYTTQGFKKVFDETGGGILKAVPFDEKKYLTTARSGFIILEGDDKGILQKTGSITEDIRVVTNFEFDNEGQVWVEYPDGIYAFSWDKPKKKTYYTYAESKVLLKYIRKYKNKLYFVTEKGVYEKSGDDFIKADLFEDLNNCAHKLVNVHVDNADNVWAFCDGEVWSSELENGQLKFKKVTLLSPFKGLYSSGYENVYTLGDSSVLIGYEAGFLHLDKIKEYHLPVSFTRINKINTTNHKSQQKSQWGTHSEKDSLISLQLYNTLPFNQNAISFNYSAGANNYRGVKYQSYLEGYSKQWSEWNESTTKEYTNLAPGDYTFKVRSMNVMGDINRTAICHFSIAAPWYRSQAAKLAYVLLGVFFIVALILYINHLLNIQEEKFKEKQKDDIEQEKQQKRHIKLEAERALIRLKNDKLKSDNLYKSKELANLTYSLIQKNKVLIEFNEELDKIKQLSESNKMVTEDIHTLIRKVNRAIDKEENWEVFEEYFDTVHENFFVKLKKKYPDFSSKDLRLCAYLRMNLTTKEIAPLMNISVRGVEIGRYRLRKKLDLDRSVNISNFLNSI